MIVLSLRMTFLFIYLILFPCLSLFVPQSEARPLQNISRKWDHTEWRTNWTNVDRTFSSQNNILPKWAWRGKETRGWFNKNVKAVLEEVFRPCTWVKVATPQCRKTLFKQSFKIYLQWACSFCRMSSFRIEWLPMHWCIFHFSVELQ